MLRLAAILYSIVATSLAGAGVIAVLAMDMVSPSAILVAAGIGAVLALPLSYLIAGRIMSLTAK